MVASMTASLVAPMASSLIQPADSSLINGIFGKGQKGVFLPLLPLPLMMKGLGKSVRTAGERYNNMYQDF